MIQDDLIYKTLLDDMDCMIEIDNEKDVYHVAKADNFFHDLLKETGNLEYLYQMLFMKEKHSSDDEIGEYRKFTNVAFFELDKHKGFIQLYDGEKEQGYFYNLLRVADGQAILVFSSAEGIEASNFNEIEKIETIQQNYLFSMMIDLTEDICINPNTTEVSAGHLDYMKLKYSDWRIMISGMFGEEDRLVFFRASEPENIINVLESRNSFHVDLQMKNMKGEFVWSRLEFTRMKNFSRQNPRFVYTVSDISEDMEQLLKQEGLVKLIEEQNQMLRESDKRRSRFFANMSHEIRTPINSIIGMNEIILRDCKDETIRGYAEDVKSANQYLLSLVNDILDYSKIQAGKMEIVPIEYNMSDLLKRVSKLVQYRVAEKDLEFVLKVSDNVPARLFGDEIRVSQILINLISNAVKYTEKGTVSLQVEAVKTREELDAIRFVVEDTGIGIRKEDMDALFTEFARIDLQHNRAIEGTGLGMSIVSGLVNQMNGTISVESEYGNGSRFEVILPQKIVTTERESKNRDLLEKERKARENLNLSGKKILVADDAELNCRVLQIMLERFHAQVDCVSSGLEALGMTKKKQYDMVLLDHMMPEMDGVEAIGKIRKQDAYYEKLPIIALTGNYSPTAKVEYQSYGFTDYLEKPLSLEKLENVLIQFFG